MTTGWTPGSDKERASVARKGEREKSGCTHQGRGGGGGGERGKGRAAEAGSGKEDGTSLNREPRRGTWDAATHLSACGGYNCSNCDGNQRGGGHGERRRSGEREGEGKSGGRGFPPKLKCATISQKFWGYEHAVLAKPLSESQLARGQDKTPQMCSALVCEQVPCISRKRERRVKIERTQEG